MERKVRTVCCFLTIVVLVASSPAGSAPWMKFGGKSKVYERSIGPGLDTIQVPFSSKTSPFFPKFVDPKSMIAKKTDMLTNMFGGYDPAMSNMQPVQKRSLFTPFRPFSPFSPFSPFNSLAYGAYGGPFSAYMTPNMYQNPVPFGADPAPMDAPSRRRRSVDEPEKSKNLGPPPPYPGLAPISEEPEERKVRSAIDPSMPPKVPLQYMPMFGPMVDPSMFISKKTMFLDNLFKTLATSTQPPLGFGDDEPVTKATIVPPNFWLPNSITPDPTEYNTKVVDFLDKLFDSLKINRTAAASDKKSKFVRSLDLDPMTQKKVSRSLDDISEISAAKDSIVDSILSELSDLKGDMVSTLDDLVAFQKTSSGTSKKPFKAGPWSKFAPDPSLPFKQRMMMIGQVFDMLTNLQRNITTAVQESINSRLDTIRSYPYDITTPGTNVNMTLLDAIRSKLSNLDPNQSFYNPYAPSAKFSRTVPQTATSFWVAYPQEGSSGTAKRQVEQDPAGVMYNEIRAQESRDEKDQRPRAVEMQMHQGYQSMPPGAIESVQAGGGSAPGHQGGGINLLIQMPEAPNKNGNGYWEDYSRNQGRRHHHNH